MGAAWTAGDYTGLRFILKREFVVAQDQIQKTQQEIEAQLQQSQKLEQLSRFQLLDMKRKLSTLTWDENMDRCKIAEALGYPMPLVDGCHGQ